MGNSASYSGSGLEVGLQPVSAEPDMVLVALTGWLTSPALFVCTAGSNVASCSPGDGAGMQPSVSSCLIKKKKKTSSESLAVVAGRKNTGRYSCQNTASSACTFFNFVHMNPLVVSAPPVRLRLQFHFILPTLNNYCVQTVHLFIAQR